MRRLALCALGFGIAGLGMPAVADGPAIDQDLEAHEIGFIDLNRPAADGGWLSTVPPSTPLMSNAGWRNRRGESGAAPHAADALRAPGGPAWRSASAGRSAPGVDQASAMVDVPLPGGDSDRSAAPAPAGAAPATPAAPVTDRASGPRGPGGSAGRTPVERRGEPGTVDSGPLAGAPLWVAAMMPSGWQPWGPWNSGVVDTPVGWPDDWSELTPEQLVEWGRQRWWATGGRDPALFFHTSRRTRVNVRVGFREGVPMAWWPAGRPQGRELRFEDVVVDPACTPATAADLDVSRWPGLAPLAAFRDVGATPVRMGKRVEGGLVYEGAMPFNPRLTVRHRDDGTYEIRNDSAMALEDVILVVAGDAAQGYALGTIPAGERRRLDPEAGTPTPLHQAVRWQLGRTGLFAGEVRALERVLLGPEFLDAPGTRLLARIPRAIWDALMPLHIEPAPRQLIRVGMVRVFDAEHYRAVLQLPVPLSATGGHRDPARDAPADALTGPVRLR